MQAVRNSKIMSLSFQPEMFNRITAALYLKCRAKNGSFCSGDIKSLPGAKRALRTLPGASERVFLGL